MFRGKIEENRSIVAWNAAGDKCLSKFTVYPTVPGRHIPGETRPMHSRHIGLLSGPLTLTQSICS